MKKTTKLCVTGLVLSLLSCNLLAEQNWYQIEVIVFAQKAPNTEQFDQTQSQLSWPKKLVKLSETTLPMQEWMLNPLSYTKLQAEDRLLQNIYYGLKKSRSYRPLVHLSWVQSARENRLSDAVQVYKKAGLQEDYEVNGYIRLQRGHYLHLITDLEYAPASAQAEPLVYRLKEKRRIKLNEIHYLDHPKFGVVATVKPIELPDQEE